MEESIKMLDVDYLVVIAALDLVLENKLYSNIVQKLELERVLAKFSKACPEIATLDSEKVF